MVSKYTAIMSKKIALKILNINEDNPDHDVIKKSYRTMALKYHPDKNHSEDAKETFIEIREAYDFLTRSYETDTPMEYDYTSIMQSFLGSIFQGESHKIILVELMRKMVGICEKKSAVFLQHIDKHILKKLFDMIITYRDIFYFSEEFIESINEIVKSKFESDERIILHPFLDDLFDNNLYKLSLDGHAYVVPLWHHHLIYDIHTETPAEIFVDCYPILPDNVFIDENNNIHIWIVKQMIDIWKTGSPIEFSLGSRTFAINTEELFIKEKQVKQIMNRGIPIINNNNLYDVSLLSDIMVYITLE